jgi:hypothetical protein
MLGAPVEQVHPESRERRHAPLAHEATRDSGLATRGYFPITSLAIVASCMFDVPS